MNKDQLRADVVKVLCVDHGHGRQSGSEHCRTCSRRADAVLEVVAPLLAEAEAEKDHAWAMAKEVQKAAHLAVDREREAVQLLSWLHAEAVWLGEVGQAAMRRALNKAHARVDEAVEECSRLRREVEFEANGTDTFAGADAAADEQMAPCLQCGGPGDNNWFDRTICAEPCGDMHTRCVPCGAALDGCPHESDAPSRPEKPSGGAV